MQELTVDRTAHPITKAIPIQVHWLLKKYPHLFIAGGFVRDAMARRPYRDIDIYGVQDAQELEDIWDAWGNEFVLGLDTWSTNRCTISMHISNVYDTDGKYIWDRKIQVQLMITGAATMGEVMNTFDIPNCRIAYYAEKDTTIHAGGGLRPTSGTLERLIKLTARGYTYHPSDFVAAAAVYEPNGDHTS